MPGIPLQLIESIRNVAGFQEPAWIKVHEAAQPPVSVRLNPAKPFAPEISAFPLEEKVPWCTAGFYLPQRPFFTFDPLLHAGAYYVQEASSMFVAHAMKTVGGEKENLRVLDLCAAPGGKSTLLQSLLAPDALLVSNEVIRSRAGILEENLTKWGGSNTVVSNNDPRDFAKLPGYFDGMVVDAPCSGSGLFRKDPDAVSEWSLDNVSLCSQRQQRILADVWPALKEEGWLIYSTCSYSEAENEAITDWVLQELEAESVPLHPNSAWNIVEVVSPEKNGYGYRFFPDQLKGEGFYLSCFRKKTAAGKISKAMGGKKKTAVPPNVYKSVQPLLKDGFEGFLFPVGEQFSILPARMENDLALLQSALYLRKAGVLLGKPTHKEWLPEHALAVSTIASEAIPYWELNQKDALSYLRREEWSGAPPFRGWGLIRYGNCSLGWIKALPNRINNYYPAAWRILKKES